MCDVATLQALLGTAAAMIAAAIVSVGIAAALNAGFFSAPGAPAPMVAAGGFSLAAVAALVAVRVLVEDYFGCMGAPDSCLGDYNNFMNALAGLITTLGIQAAACFVAAGIAWIPWGAQPAMLVILAAFIVQAALIPTLTVFWVALDNCLRDAATASSTGPLVVSTAVFVFLGVGFAYLINRKGRRLKGGGN